ncbi:hypothetical protein N7486_008200 [Penicillium sp. IBT 16267x]|nr:hypothetical protein N7486_008200 [Penicillium sp. IBT 16267x]
MLGLGAYDSSSEEEVEIKTPAPQHQKQSLEISQANLVKGDSSMNSKQIDDSETNLRPLLQLDQYATEDTPSQLSPSRSNEVPNGPVLGPASMNTTPFPEERSAGGSTSPFSASRALIQDLTLPPDPPDPAANTKFEHFLSLKKQGVHFNAKLASSSSLKNPSLLTKMMEHAGIDEQAQYNTSLPVGLWNTSTLPSWAFKEELLRAQQEARQRMDDKKAFGQRSSIEFVSGPPIHPPRVQHGDQEKRQSVSEQIDVSSKNNFLQ